MDRVSQFRGRAGEEVRFIWPPLILAIVTLWIIPMGTSLGLDETGNDWVIQGGLQESFARSGLWAGTSWISNALMIAARSIGGDREFVLRMPALFAAAITLLLYLLGKRLVGQLAAAYACLVFVCLRDVVYVVSTMRPYSLALLFVTGAMFCLVRWLDTGSVWFGLAYTGLAAGTLHAHYLFAPALLVHLIYFLWRSRGLEPLQVRFRTVACAWASICLLGLPLVPNLRQLLSRGVSSLYLGRPNTGDFLLSLAPPVLLGSIVLAVLLTLSAGRDPLRNFRMPDAKAPFIAAWILIPSAVLFLVSVLTETHVFAERYILPSSPAIALAGGCVIAGFGSESVRRTIASSVAICAFLVFGVHESFSRGLHDWRAAAAAVRDYVHDSSTPVLVVSGFTEARELGALQDPRYVDVLYAPLVRYPIPGVLVRLPLVMTAETEPYLESIVENKLTQKKEFLLFGIDSYSTREYRSWLSGRTGPLHFTSRSLGNYGGIQVTVFSRREP